MKGFGAWRTENFAEDHGLPSCAATVKQGGPVIRVSEGNARRDALCWRDDGAGDLRAGSGNVRLGLIQYKLGVLKRRRDWLQRNREAKGLHEFP